ncbi:MAG: protein MetE [Elusimicrobia bacterium]|nr:MAG: protein MetE [Elusimicrobiota bacterium]
MDYAGFLPAFFGLKAGNFYVELAGEKDRARVLKLVAEHLGKGRRAFVGVTDPISRRVETAEEVRDHVLAAAAALGPERLGTTDDCGFSPFGDDVSTSRETAFAKIKARLEGTALAAAKLGV